MAGAIVLVFALLESTSALRVTPGVELEAKGINGGDFQFKSATTQGGLFQNSHAKVTQINRLGLLPIAPPHGEMEGSLDLQNLPSKLQCPPATKNMFEKSSVDASIQKMCADLVALDIPSQLKLQRDKMGAGTVAWTPVSKDRAPLIPSQVEQVQNANMSLLLINMDLDSAFAKTLCEQGYAVLDFSTWFHDHPNPNFPWSTKMRYSKIKFTMPEMLLEMKADNVYMDLDVFWIHDPMPYFQSFPGADLIFGTHADNPHAKNMGMWYQSGSASTAVKNIFSTTWSFMQNRMTKACAEDLYCIFDQNALQTLLHAVNGDSPSCEGETNTVVGAFCHDVLNLQSELKGIAKIVTLDNDRIISSHVAEHDEKALMVHVLTSGPFTNFDAKVFVAKNGGIFQGTPDYYEATTSTTQYLAWDGQINGASKANRYCDYYSCAMARVIPVLLHLGKAMQRTVILPKEIDRGGFVWFGEQILNVGGADEASVDIRESNFLYNPRLNVSAMFPVAQVHIDNDDWAGFSVTDHHGGQPQGNSWHTPQAHLTQLIQLLSHENVKKAKTILLSFPSIEYNEAHLQSVLDDESCAIDTKGSNWIWDAQRYCDPGKAIKAAAEGHPQWNTQREFTDPFSTESLCHHE